jgi:hypothetical protein
VETIATVHLQPGEETCVGVLYAPPAEAVNYRSSPHEAVKTSVRRYGSEFRDSVVSRYEQLDALAALARGLLKNR